MLRPSSSSPAHKRQRLSSPTYDDQVEELTQDDLAAFDAIELRLSQQATASTCYKKPRLGDDKERFRNLDRKMNLEWGSSQPQGSSSSLPGFSFAGAKQPELAYDPDNPFTVGLSSSTKSPVTTFKPPTLVGFALASKLPISKNHAYERSPSPEVPPEPDLDSWFNPAPGNIPTAAFTTPMFAPASAVAGFTTASSKAIIVPSKEALAKAKAKLDSWSREIDDNEHNTENTSPLNPKSGNPAVKPVASTGFKLASTSFIAQSPQRVAFQPVTNTLSSPNTPSPSGFSRPSVAGPSKTITQPNFHRPGQFKPPSFKQPHISTPGPGFGSPLNPNRNVPSQGFVSAASQHPLAAPPVTTSRDSGSQTIYTNASSFTTPLRPRLAQPVLKTMPTPFKTPFKPGMRPGEPGRAALTPIIKGKGTLPLMAIIPNSLQSNQSRPAREERLPKQRNTFFKLAPPSHRKTLAESGLRPQQYEVEDLEYMGVNTTTLSQITPKTAMYYTFHTTASTPPSTLSAPSVMLGPAQALNELLERGCSLATKPWVDNHWSLILWKLAGMVGLDPEKEIKPDETKWCWPEVIRQLLYRYERELNGGSRPPLRKIANQDAPAAFPMVLCVSDILWSPAGITEDGLPIEPHPELEVTDGWYRLRAQVDLPMARAVRKGTIRIGRKLGVAGAKLSTEKKDPSEILDAYNSTKLVFTGNSSHLMPWHAKLGFMRGPCISTLHSLTHDGGLVTALDLVIIRTLQVAFLEFKEDENGKKEQEGPRNEVEENQVNEQWKRRYETEASKLRAQYDQKYYRYDGYLDRLERKAGNKFNPEDEDGPPDSIDSLFDELEFPDTAAAVIARISPTEAGWLARHIRRQREISRERMSEEIEQEMKTICPPRNVRSFRMLVVQDARTLRKPGHREGVLTVWDALGLSLDEDEGKVGGGFEVGQRYLVTNLSPTQLSAWMDDGPGSQVFLCTTRNTRWTRIPASKE